MDLLPEQLDALEDVVARLPRGVQERGLAYAADGRVGDLQVEPQRIAAVVHGTTPYTTVWRWNGGGHWTNQCSCPLGGACKHAVAVANVVLEGGEAAAPQDPMQLLRESKAMWERQAALDDLLVGAPDARLSPYGPPLEQILREPDPDVRCWRLAEAIAAETGGWVPEPLELFRRRGDVADRFRDRERAATASALLDWARRRSELPPRRLRLVFDLIPGGAEPLLVFEVRLSTPRLHDAPRTIAQVHGLRTESLRDPSLFPPEQASVLSWLADAAQSATSDWNTTALAVPQRIALLERAADAGIAYWAGGLDPELAARAGIAPGSPVRVSTQAALLVPTCVTRDGELDLELRLRWPNGVERRLDEVLYIGGPTGLAGRYGSLVIADGEVNMVGDEPPAQLRERFLAQGPLRVPRSERVELVGALAEAFPHLRTTLRAHTRTHAVAPSVALDLRSDDWLMVRAFARAGRVPWNPGAPAGDDAPLFELLPGRGWVRIDAQKMRAAGFAELTTNEPEPQPAPEPAQTETGSGSGSGSSGEVADPWLELPDPAAVEPVMAWLRRLPLADAVRAGREDDTRVGGWWMRAGKRALETLAEAWEERPAGVAFYGTDGLRRLFGAARAAGPKLRVRASGVDWLTVSAAWEAEGLKLSEADLAALRAASGRFVKLDAGWVRRDLVEEHDEAAELLADLGIALDAGEQRLGVWQLAGASADGLAHLAQLGVDPETLAALEALRERIAAFTGIPPVELPGALTATLRPYQKQGLDFLAYTAAMGLGAVLADDMGLGKTVQALAWLLHLRRQAPEAGPALVVCPASVVHNWAREAARFAPDLRLLLLTSGKERHALREEIPNHDLIITTYALLRRDADDWREVTLGAAILDEAQFIKNPDAAVSKTALELQARHRLALTGTPLENRALDLWSIMQFVNPGYLGTRGSFVRTIDRADAPPHLRALLSAKLRPVLLRRTKRAVAPELPPRIEERRDCELTAEQRQLYLAELGRTRTLLRQAGTAPDGINRERLNILAALTRLRQICCHPALAGGRPDLGSGKFDGLFELLEPLLDEGHKVLVFSQFVQCIKLLQAALKGRGIRFHTLTGSTTKREKVVAAFQEDPDPSVFLVSLKAGGTGLNLTAASYVVLFDPWWNPAVEAQAIDRTHRIGQDRTVIAYRMLARGTIEERIWELQQRKATLVRDVLGEGGFARALTRDDLEYLLADVTAA
ncbi:MAG: DEAD/DEAH box helicase [Deltaproteobacteria bacterium]|nr:DEAD/DEAH box helicase [Deltaproteobacteria bacterium]